MEIIGSFEAKTHWSALLEKVGKGEEVIITKRGKAIARLIPEASQQDREREDIVTSLKTLRKECLLQGEDWQAWRDDGRS